MLYISNVLSYVHSVSKNVTALQYCHKVICKPVEKGVSYPGLRDVWGPRRRSKI